MKHVEALHLCALFNARFSGVWANPYMRSKEKHDESP